MSEHKYDVFIHFDTIKFISTQKKTAPGNKKWKKKKKSYKQKIKNFKMGTWELFIYDLKCALENKMRLLNEKERSEMLVYTFP